MSGLNDDHQHSADDTHADAGDGDQHGVRGRGTAGPDRYRRIEVITGEVRRRSWSREEKARITTLSFEPGCNVSALARENGVSIGLLHYWRRVARERMNEGAVRFVPLVAAAPTERGLGSAGVIELELLGARIRITGGVDRAALETVLAAVRASA